MLPSSLFALKPAEGDFSTPLFHATAQEEESDSELKSVGSFFF